MSTQMLAIIDTDPWFHLANSATLRFGPGQQRQLTLIRGSTSLVRADFAADPANSGLSEASGMRYRGERRTPDRCAVLQVIVSLLAALERVLCARAHWRRSRLPARSPSAAAITGITASDHRNNPKPILKRGARPIRLQR
jgi:hypothetical protein